MLVVIHAEMYVSFTSIYSCVKRGITQSLPLYHFLSLFSDAVQMIFSMHCCLHLVGQAVSVGNLDRLLISYYNQDIQSGKLTPKMVIHTHVNFCYQWQERITGFVGDESFKAMSDTFISKPFFFHLKIQCRLRRSLMPSSSNSVSMWS